MNAPTKPNLPEDAGWGSQSRLMAADKWKAKSAAMGKAVTAALVDYAQPKPGMRVLDLASGTGEPAISIAMLVGTAGRVTALDLSADLLEIASARAQERGLDNFFTQQGDAQSLAFEDENFDLATCRFGVMFFSDPVLALRELRRVLRPGARACFLAWGPFEQPYFQSTMKIVHRHAGGPLLPPDGPDPFRFALPGNLSSVLKSAGFGAVEEATKTLPWVWPGPPEEFWEQMRAVAAPFRPLLDRVPTDRWPQVQQEVLAAIGQYVRGECIEFSATVVLASGQK